MSAQALTAAAFIPSVDAQYTPEFLIGSGVTATKGQIGYLDTSVSPPVIRLASAASTAAIAGSITSPNGAVGFIDRAGGAGQAARLLIRDPNLALGATILAGDDVWAHTTAGSVTKTIGDLASTNYKLHLGTMKSTTVLDFKVTGPGLLA